MYVRSPELPASQPASVQFQKNASLRMHAMIVAQGLMKGVKYRQISLVLVQEQERRVP